MPRSAPPLVALALLAILGSALVLVEMTTSGPPATAGQVRAGQGRADLTVASGSVSAGAGQVVGRVTVRNTGGAGAPSTTTGIRVDGKRVRSVVTRAVGPGAQRVMRFRARVGDGTHSVTACADRRRQVAEREEGNNCRAIGMVTVTSSTVPTDPIGHTDNVVFKVGAAPHEYWLNVPPAYDNSHATPIRLVVFVHGCQMYAADTANQIKEQMTSTSLDEFILMTPGLGRDGQCWDASADVAPLVDAIADVKTHFNVDRRRVVIGGYSSGSPVVGRVAFDDAASYAGLFILPGRPFRSTEDRTQMIADADWKLNVAWRAHRSDEFYPISVLRSDKRALVGAGFPVAFSEVDAEHVFDAADLDYVFSRLVSWKAPR